ncbi:hypothetical protein CHELA20_51877 [Hyphomicrobiales bacterium]|nr:hypothetical protein CHELA41_23134 [Hyphomicrobiales bacterium]CAH1679135.1 hypothetical protein CHELA20_51877 [Hyphomicrobiales bacterium]
MAFAEVYPADRRARFVCGRCGIARGGKRRVPFDWKRGLRDQARQHGGNGELQGTRFGSVQYPDHGSSSTLVNDKYFPQFIALNEK